MLQCWVILCAAQKETEKLKYYFFGEKMLFWAPDKAIQRYVFCHANNAKGTYVLAVIT